MATPIPPIEATNTGKLTRYLDTPTAYDLWSEVYDTDGNILQALDTIEMRSLLPKFLSQIPFPQPWKLVDLGCGTGRNYLQLLDVPGATILGLDTSSKMLEIARTRLNERMAVLEREPQKAKEFELLWYDMLSSAPMPTIALNADALISTLVLEHIPQYDFFQAISRVLKAGGLALVTNMHPDMGKISQAGFVDPKTGEKVRPQSYAHALEDVIEEARKQGFEIVGEVLERAVDEKTSEVLGVRAKKWIGINVWFGVCFRKRS
ncbi:hypothetical protein N7G274_005000 [Stereocaulon virgatum]|uniref:Methyltransferase type 11 domain-containing protein n=1 Tax=Stereocaulon virgatum TaxID=373712 RepID=A0ABR4A9E2_9LECA